jgi:RNA polymerase sigma-70 factor, ECF subfamily
MGAVDPEHPFDVVLAAARTGAEWALAEIFRDIHPRLIRYLRARDPAEAEDLASEVWLDLAAALPSFEGDDRSLRALAFTIARRRLVDQRRRARRRPTGPLLTDQASALAGGDVEEEAMEAISTRAALARIAALPPDQADVVLLRVIAGLGVDEVATILDKRPGAIRALQHRALRRLASMHARKTVTT